MPRIRSLKPEHRQHRKIGPLEHVVYRLWVGMICEADDAGRLVADPEQLRVLIFGFRPEVTAQIVTDGLVTLRQAGLIRLYRAATGDQKTASTMFAEFPSWTDHQRINRPSESKLPPFKDTRISRIHGGLTDPSLRTHAGSDLIGGDQGSEGSGGPRANGGPPPGAPVVYRIPSTVSEALDRAPVLGRVARLRDPAWWQAELRANEGIEPAAEVYKAEAWLKSNPKRRKSDYVKFLHNWLARAEREPEDA